MQKHLGTFTYYQIHLPLLWSRNSLFFYLRFYTYKFPKKIEALFTVGTFIILAVWALYMPVLVVITMLRAIRKVKHNVNELNMTLSEQPWKMTPKRLYTEPHWGMTIFALYLKDYVIDFLDWCTQFFLFDFIYPDRIRYPLTKKIRHNSRHIEGLIADMNIPLKYVGFEVNMQNTNYKFEFYEEVKSIEKVLARLEKGFKKTDYYVRENEGQIHVIAPHTQLQK